MTPRWRCAADLDDTACVLLSKRQFLERLGFSVDDAHTALAPGEQLSRDRPILRLPWPTPSMGTRPRRPTPGRRTTPTRKRILGGSPSAGLPSALCATARSATGTESVSAVIRAPGRKRFLRWLVGSHTTVAIAGLYLLVFVSVASASFPGGTGRLVFEESVSGGSAGDGDDGCATCSAEVIRVFNPFTRRLLAPNPCRDSVECGDSSPAVSPDGRRIS